MDALACFIGGLVCVFLVLHLNLEERGWGVLLGSLAAVAFIAGLILLLAPDAPPLALHTPSR